MSKFNGSGIYVRKWSKLTRVKLKRKSESTRRIFIQSRMRLVYGSWGYIVNSNDRSDSTYPSSR